MDPAVLQVAIRPSEVKIDGETMLLRDLIDRVEASTAEAPAPYLRNQLLAEWPPELLAEVLPMPECTRPNWLESRFFPSRERPYLRGGVHRGPRRALPWASLRRLHTHAFLMQLYGEKEYMVFAPDQSRFMYPQEEGPKSLVDDAPRT